MNGLGQEAMGVIRTHLEPLLAEDVVDELLDHLAQALDAAGIVPIPTAELEQLRARHRVYRSSLLQLSHALEVALTEGHEHG